MLSSAWPSLQFVCLAQSKPGGYLKQPCHASLPPKQRKQSQLHGVPALMHRHFLTQPMFRSCPILTCKPPKALHTATAAHQVRKPPRPSTGNMTIPCVVQTNLHIAHPPARHRPCHTPATATHLRTTKLRPSYTSSSRQTRPSYRTLLLQPKPSHSPDTALVEQAKAHRLQAIGRCCRPHVPQLTFASPAGQSPD